jgi:hypothetical protein
MTSDPPTHGEIASRIDGIPKIASQIDGIPKSTEAIFGGLKVRYAHVSLRECASSENTECMLFNVESEVW